MITIDSDWTLDNKLVVRKMDVNVGILRAAQCMYGILMASLKSYLVPGVHHTAAAAAQMKQQTITTRPSKRCCVANLLLCCRCCVTELLEVTRAPMVET